VNLERGFRLSKSKIDWRWAMRRLGVLVMVLGAVLVWTGGAAASHTGWYFGSGGPRITITISEFKFTPAMITLEAGKPVDIILENKGIQGHVFMVYTKPTKPFPSNAGDRWEYVLANTYLQGMGEIMIYSRNEFIVAGTSISEITLDPGKKATLTFVPSKKGTFEFGCLLSGGNVDHYKAGMIGALIVK
jgi:uncharacterized cupredoxin-like copper-binding protein